MKKFKHNETCLISNEFNLNFMILNSLTWVLWSKIWCACALELKHYLQKITHFSLLSSSCTTQHKCINFNRRFFFFIHLIIVKEIYKSLKRRETKKHYIDCQRQVYVYKSLKKTSRIKSMNNVYRTYRIYSWNLWVNFFFFLIEEFFTWNEDGGDPQFTPESNFPIKSSLCIFNSIKLKLDLID